MQKTFYKTKPKQKRLINVIPCTINKFLLEVSTEVKEFKQRWKNLKKEAYCYSDEFGLNSFLLKGPTNIKNYFQYLIHLNPHQEYDFLTNKGKMKMGSLFYIENRKQEILLKIVFYGNGKMSLRSASKGNTFKICEFLLKTLIFLFSK